MYGGFNGSPTWAGILLVLPMVKSDCGRGSMCFCVEAYRYIQGAQGVHMGLYLTQQTCWWMMLRYQEGKMSTASKVEWIWFRKEQQQSRVLWCCRGYQDLAKQGLFRQQNNVQPKMDKLLQKKVTSIEQKWLIWPGLSEWSSTLQVFIINLLYGLRVIPFSHQGGDLPWGKKMIKVVIQMNHCWLNIAFTSSLEGTLLFCMNLYKDSDHSSSVSPKLHDGA